MFAAARAVLEEGVARRVFPAAVIEVGTATDVRWSAAFGRLTFDVESSMTREDTIFDLASLTKVLCTAPLMMQLVEQGVVGLDDEVRTHLDRWRRSDRASVTLRDLLSHSSGLPAHRPYFQTLVGRVDYESAICEEPLEYAPRSKSIYSDLGFILLGFLLDSEGLLSDRFTALLEQMRIADPLLFDPPAGWRHRIAPTTDDPWRQRQLVGEVDDENAAALGGIAGHAGLFGTAAAVGACARHVLQVLDDRTGAYRRVTLEEFITRRTDVPESSRALGWDTMLPTSSCGTQMSTRAFGHTGFTGTSLWIDPERAIYVVLLTNRVYPARQDHGIQEIRRRVHDAVMTDLR